MFVDIVNFSRMMGADEMKTMKLLDDFFSIVTAIINKYNGNVIKRPIPKNNNPTEFIAKIMKINWINSKNNSSLYHIHQKNGKNG